MDRPSLGDQELEVLRFIADHAPVTAREIIDGFGRERGLARTTVLTVVERLRKKGYLTRKHQDGVYSYTPHMPPGDVMQGVVRRFIEKTLGGSVSPVVAYLAHGHTLSEKDLSELRQLVEDLQPSHEIQSVEEPAHSEEPSSRQEPSPQEPSPDDVSRSGSAAPSPGDREPQEKGGKP